MLFGLIGCFVGIVFLFFSKIRTRGVIVFVISIISIFVGFRSCKNEKHMTYAEIDEQREMDESLKEEDWYESSINLSLAGANLLIEEEIVRIKKELVIDSLEIYLKCTKDLAFTIRSFENRLVTQMNNLTDRKNYPFKAFDFEKLYRFKRQKNWINSTKFAVPIGDQLLHVSGVLSNDSSCIVYDGFLNVATKTIYWTGFHPEELIVTDFNNYSRYESASKFLNLTNSAKEWRVNLIYWEAQKKIHFNTKQFAFRGDQEINEVQLDGVFIPFYKVNHFILDGKIVLRDFYNF